MKFIGNERIVNILKKSIEKDQIFHAYLFSGPSNLGKKTLALKFAQDLQCSDNDLHILDKNSPIKIEEIRDLQHKLQLSSQSKYKIAIINDAALITQEAANALLKTLEEPVRNTILILITQNKEKIIPTITSRCIIYNFNLVTQKQINNLIQEFNLTPKEKEQILTLSCGRPGIALALVQNKKALLNRRKFLSNFNRLLQSDINTQFLFVEKIFKQDLNKTINIWLSWFRDLLLIKSSNHDLVLNQANLPELKQISAKYSSKKIIDFIDYLKNLNQQIPFVN